MKPINRFYLLVLTILIFSCSKQDESLEWTTYFVNTTDFQVTIRPTVSNSFELTIPAGETKSITTKEFFVLIDIEEEDGIEKRTNWTLGNNSDYYYIYAFDFDVVYRITGSSPSASYTINTSNGGTAQGTVNIPHNISIKEFQDDFVYLSAQNEHNFGNVKVEILIEDRPVYVDQSSGQFGIATASGNRFGHQRSF